LLFCNGSGTTLRAVRPLLDLVAARFDLLAWDYRGLGRSVPLTDPTMADLAADAVGLLQIAGWATKAGICSFSKIRPRFRNTRHSCKHRLCS
jgi:pimeloyl-ACP methyl ester carboxylesterase